MRFSLLTNAISHRRTKIRVDTRAKFISFSLIWWRKKVLWLICDNVPSNTYIFSWSLIELETRQYQPPQMPGRHCCSARHTAGSKRPKLSSLVKVSIFLDGAAFFPYPTDVISSAVLIFFIPLIHSHMGAAANFLKANI